MTGFLQHLPPLLVYLVVAAVVAGETAVLPGVVVPSLTTLLLAGFLARVGTVELVPLALVTVAAGVLGDHLGFLEGRRVGPRLRRSRAGRWIGEARWGRADTVLDRRGGGAVFVGRWLTVVRTLVPRLAGASAMPLRRFAPYDTAGVLTWAAAELGAGYLAGASYQTVAKRFGTTALALAVLAAGVVLLVLISSWVGRNPRTGQAIGEALARFGLTRWLARHYLAGLESMRRRFGRGGALAVTAVVLVVVVCVGGYLTALLVQSAVVISGMADIDQAATRWVLSGRDPGLARAAAVLVTTVKGAAVLLVALAAALAVMLRRRPGDRRYELIRVVVLFAPLVVMAAVIDAHQPSAALPDPTRPVLLFPGEHAVVVAGIGMATWLVSYRRGRTGRAVAWTVAAVVVLVLTAARLYVGWSRPSNTVAALLLGVLWATAVIGAWHSSSRLNSGPPPEPVADPGRSGHDGVRTAVTSGSAPAPGESRGRRDPR